MAQNKFSFTSEEWWPVPIMVKPGKHPEYEQQVELSDDELALYKRSISDFLKIAKIINNRIGSPEHIDVLPDL